MTPVNPRADDEVGLSRKLEELLGSMEVAPAKKKKKKARESLG